MTVELTMHIPTTITLAMLALLQVIWTQRTGAGPEKAAARSSAAA